MAKALSNDKPHSVEQVVPADRKEATDDDSDQIESINSGKKLLENLVYHMKK